MTPERLRELLDAYGAAPARWPEAERVAGSDLIAASAAARALSDGAAALDRVLDAATTSLPSQGLAARVLAGVPRRRPRPWRAGLMAAFSLAAAAALAIWLRTHSESARETATISTIALGAYESPTDVLLEPFGLALYTSIPSIGCYDSALGCPRIDTAGTAEPSKGGA
ncbi:MAG TPA: hypothetical protein VMS22_06035 [Candidatus Eisenbacteria bacterium]|nr:hypothetical protein [Candidatus Eisenbacteria bacterium]